MFRLQLRGTAALSVTMALAFLAPPLARAQTAPQSLVIGVDHLDLANQRPDQARVFEYTDFFSREVNIHSGDTLDFRWAPGAFHIIALAPSEDTARAVYPIAVIDTDDNHPAPGTGLPKIQLGPSNGPITGGSVRGGGQIGGPNDIPTCGVTAFGQKACTFAGGGDIENSGGIGSFDPNTGMPIPVDWMMQVTAGPGDYDYFCYIHPGMRGKLHVVASGQPASTQADIDAKSALQFKTDQMLALDAEQFYNVDNTTTDIGTVTHHVAVGVSAADNHVAIDEMLPRKVSVSNGDQVEFKWRDSHNVHTVGVAQAESQLPPPFLFDCGTSTIAPPGGPPGAPSGGGFCFEVGQPMLEVIGDPGTSLSGALLTDVQTVLNSGFLIGSDFGIQPSTQTWSVRTDTKTKAGNYQFWCSVHDFMNGTLAVGQ